MFYPFTFRVIIGEYRFSISILISIAFLFGAILLCLLLLLLPFSFSFFVLYQRLNHVFAVRHLDCWAKSLALFLFDGEIFYSWGLDPGVFYLWTTKSELMSISPTYKKHNERQDLKLMDTCRGFPTCKLPPVFCFLWICVEISLCGLGRCEFNNPFSSAPRELRL